MSQATTIIWRRLDKPGHESARLLVDEFGCHLSGASVFLHEDRPCRLDYLIDCDSGWLTKTTRVTGWLGKEEISIAISVSSEGRWLINEKECPEVEGFLDVDLNFTSVTNTLPIRRLDLAIGDEAAVRAAWLRFPDFTLEPLEQSYHRMDSKTYRYESGGGSFVRELKVNEAGLITLYPDFFQAES